MMTTFLLRWLGSAVTRARPGTKRPDGGRRLGPPRPGVERLEDRNLLSATVTIGALGDSLTAPYAGAPYVAPGEQNWVEQLRAHDGARLIIDDVAVPGATSSDLLAGGQASTVAANHSVRYAVLIIGANDVAQHLPDFAAGNPGAFVNQVVANIETALDTLSDAGKTRLAVGTIPDVTLTPYFQSQSLPPALVQEISGAIAAANQQIEAFAARQGIPVIDLAGLGKLAQGNLVVGGVQVSSFYGPDGFHPGTVAQGLLADAVVDAFASAYNPRLSRFRLTDQQILDDAGIAHGTGHTYFDLSPYILFHPSPRDGDRDAADALFASYRHDVDSPASPGLPSTNDAPGASRSDSDLDSVTAKGGAGERPAQVHARDLLFANRDFDLQDALR